MNKQDEERLLTLTLEARTFQEKLGRVLEQIRKLLRQKEEIGAASSSEN